MSRKYQALGALSFATFIVLPAWTVNEATTVARVMWTFVTLFFSFMVASMASAAEFSPKEGQHRPRRRPAVWKLRQPYLTLTSQVAFAGFVCSAAAITHVTPGVGVIGAFGDGVSYLGAHVFPIVADYATELNPALAPNDLFRLQATVSLAFFAGLAVFVPAVVLLFQVPRDEFHLIVDSSNMRPEIRVIAYLLIALMAVLAVSGISGLPPEFWGPPTLVHRLCPASAHCYAYLGNLGLIGNVGFKSLFMFWCGFYAIATYRSLWISRPPGRSSGA